MTRFEKIIWMSVFLLILSVGAFVAVLGDHKRSSSMRRHGFTLIERDSTLPLIDSTYGVINREWVRQQLNERR